MAMVGMGPKSIELNKWTFPLEEQLAIWEEIAESESASYLPWKAEWKYKKRDLADQLGFTMLLYDRRYFSNLTQSFFHLDGDPLGRCQKQNSKIEIFELKKETFLIITL